MRLLPFAATALIVGLAGVAIVSRPGGVVAGTALRMEVPELVRGSDLIVEGRVLSGEAFESDGRIETEYLIEVERTFVGEDQPYRAVRIPGGVLPDGSGMMLAGMPRITPGETALLFLSEAGATGVRMPVGLAQGKFQVLEAESGAKTLVRDSSGVTLVDRSGALHRGEGRSVLGYAQVTAEIEAALAARRAR